MVWFLWEEWSIAVHRATISRTLTRLKRRCKKANRLGPQNHDLRMHWIADLLNLTAEQLVFIDESHFNQTTGWPFRIYAAIKKKTRYNADIRREKSWSVLPAYTANDYLPCVEYKKESFKINDLLEWLTTGLLPYCNPYSAHRSVIIIDNVSAHCNSRIREVIKTHECRIKYLSPYSSDYNPIELSFSVLKAWVKKHYDELWPRFQDFESSFEDFLKYAVQANDCDQFAIKHFKHSAQGNYIFEENIEALNEQLAQCEIEFDSAN